MYFGLHHLGSRASVAAFSSLWLNDISPRSNYSHLSTVAASAIVRDIAVIGEPSQVSWLIQLSALARTAILPSAILAFSTSWLAYSLLSLRGSHSWPSSSAWPIRWSFEIVSQLARAAALVSLVVACAQSQIHWLYLALVAYGFLLGLSRLADHARWRHVALHQVNFVFCTSWALLLVAQYLPCIERGSSCARLTSIVAASLALTASNVIAVSTPREWVQPPADFDVTGLQPPTAPAPEEDCSWINYHCTFDWMTPTVLKGVCGKLDMSTIPKLPWYDEPLLLLHKLQCARSISRSTLCTLIRFQRNELLPMALWISAGHVAENIAPYAMFNLLAYLDGPDDATYKPWIWLFLVFAGPLIRSVLAQQYVIITTKSVVRVKSAMTQELYRKAMTSLEPEQGSFETSQRNERESVEHQKSTSAGRMANLMAADIDAIVRARDLMIVLVGVPIGTMVSIIGMYNMLGWVAIVGTALWILATPVSVCLGKLMFIAQQRVRKAQDGRMSLITEYLASIRAVKYFAWERPAMDKILAARAIEQKCLWLVDVLQVAINELTQLFPQISLLLMFGLHVGLQKRPLEASTAFTTLYLVKNIRKNIMAASVLSRTFAGAAVAMGRLDKYLNSSIPHVKHLVGPLRIRDGSFRRSNESVFRLRDVNIDFVEGGLNVVTGQSGSGKSTLLLAILGECILEDGTVTAPADIAFASQTPWLQNTTIQDSILFGGQMERERYDRVVSSCCLAEDFWSFPKGDQTMTGEKGASLSGGQRARIALARALYSGAPLLLLDDVFSALDARTCASVWKNCFCDDLLKGRTTVLVTQIPWISPQADLSILLEDGRVENVTINISAIRRAVDVMEAQGEVDDGGSESELEMETPLEPRPEWVREGVANGRSLVGAMVPLAETIEQETKASGKTGRRTFLQYMRYFGHPLFVVGCLVSLFLANASNMLANLWLSIWVEAYKHQAHVDSAFYMGIFAVVNASESILHGFAAILFEWGAWRAGRKLHNDFVRAIMAGPLSWFEAIPAGRITNRFAGDMASIDGVIGTGLRTMLDTFMMLLFRIGAVSAIMPVFVVPSILACLSGVIVGEMFTRTVVVVKRLTSSAQSPVFSQFADSLDGLAIIRARRGMVDHFGAELADKLRVWSAAAETNYTCNRWVAIRIDFVTALVALMAGIIAVSKAGTVGTGLVGFSLTNANDLSQTILLLVRAMNGLEVEMQSFHRVQEYSRLEPEEKEEGDGCGGGSEAEGGGANDEGREERVISEDWPRSGHVEFRNVTIRYDPEGPDIIRNVDLEFKPGQRVAIVGRTGSGKTTLVLSLLRFTHLAAGRILLDGVDIRQVPRRRLRESLSLIPQEATLFGGSVASNLDPAGRVPRPRLEAALASCRPLASLSTPSTSGPSEAGLSLATTVEAGGANFSLGQRQVLSLGRVLVRPSRLLLLDEATANTDYQTDRAIQDLLRRQLAPPEDSSSSSSIRHDGQRTLVTIAHRLRTIVDYDLLVVMSAGRVVETGSPTALYHAGGLFHDMVCHSGEAAELRALLAETAVAQP